jgi:hypothetical protein
MGAHVVPSFPKLVFSIYPLREVNLNNFIYHINNPFVYTGTGEDVIKSIPLTTDNISDLLNIGYRPFNNFTTKIPVKTTTDLQELLVDLSNKNDITAQVENVIREEFNTGFLKASEVLDETSFDCTAPIQGFDSLDCMEYSEIKATAKFEDLKFLVNFYSVGDEDNDGYFTLTFSSSSDTKTFYVRTKVRKYVRRTGYSVAGTPVYEVVTVRAEEGTGSLSVNKRMNAVIKALYQIVSKTNYSSGGGVFSELASGIKLSKRSFAFKAPVVSFQNLNPLRTSIGDTSFGVLVHQEGVTPTKEIKKDGGVILVADFSKCFSYGTIDLKNLNSSENLLNFSGELTVLPSKPDAMDKIKLYNAVTNSDFSSDLSGWVPSLATVLRETYPENRVSIEFTAAPLGSVVVDLDTSGYTKANEGSRVYIEVVVADFEEALGSVVVTVDNTAMGKNALIIAEIDSAGFHLLVSSVLTEDVDWDDVEVSVAPNTSENGIIKISSLKVGECSEGNY